MAGSYGMVSRILRKTPNDPHPCLIPSPLSVSGTREYDELSPP